MFCHVLHFHSLRFAVLWKHKRIHPNIKHNRVIASLMSFSHPNISVLISEIEKFIKTKGRFKG